MKYRLVHFVFIGVIFILTGAGCAWVNKGTTTGELLQGASKVKVAATIFPAYDLVRTVGGDDIQTEIIIEPRISEHYFEPTASKMKQLENSKVIFAIGQNLDNYTENLVENIPGARVVTLDRGITIRPTTEHEEEGEAEHGPTDPHYWLSPADALVMIDTITIELGTLAPENKADFEARAKTLKEQIAQKDVEWKKAIATLPKKEVVTFHDAFYYFADHFGLTVVTTFEPFPGQEPSPKYLAHLQKEVKEHGITHLFVEPQLPQDSLRTFAEDNKITLGLLDPVGGVAERDSYIDLIDFNVKQVVQSLQ